MYKENHQDPISYSVVDLTEWHFSGPQTVRAQSVKDAAYMHKATPISAGWPVTGNWCIFKAVLGLEKPIEHENANFRKWPLPKPGKIELYRLIFFWIWRLHRSPRYTSEWSWKFKCPQCQSRMNKILCRVDCGRLLLNKGWCSHTSSHTNTMEPQDLEIKHIISSFSSRFIQILIEKPSPHPSNINIGDDWSTYPERTPRSSSPPNKAL